MSKPIAGPNALRQCTLACLLAAACSKASPRSAADTDRIVAQAGQVECAEATFHPSSAPPGEGVWTAEGRTDGTGVAALIGPAEIRSGSTRVTRTIETVESRTGRLEQRHRLDTAVMHLEFLPSYHDAAVAPTGGNRDPTRARQPAAVYSLGATVLLASYEACSGLAPPAVRYLRVDDQGRIITDAMLRRESLTK